MKKCSKCHDLKENSCFRNHKTTKDGLDSWCKQCEKQYQKEYKKEYESKPDIKLHRKEYLKQYYNNEEVKEHRKKYLKKRSEQSEIKERRNLLERKRRQIDPLYKLQQEMSSMINAAFKNKGWSKDSTTQELLGCTFEEFLTYLGPKPKGKVHKDHICPKTQAKTKEELIKLQHYSNFRWLTAKDNLQKHNHKTPEAEQKCRDLLGREWID